MVKDSADGKVELENMLYISKQDAEGNILTYQGNEYWPDGRLSKLLKQILETFCRKSIFDQIALDDAKQTIITDTRESPMVLFTKAQTVMIQFQHKRCNLTHDKAVSQIMRHLPKEYVVAYTEKINKLEGQNLSTLSIMMELCELIRRLSLSFEIKETCIENNLELVLYLDDRTKICWHC